MKILVTGGAGYIGSHTTRTLEKAGHQITVFDNLSTGYKEAVQPHTRFILGDVRDSAHLEYLFKKENIEAVVHLAAKLEATASLQNPDEYYENNVVGTLGVLKACQANHVKKVIFSSTATVYGSATSGKFSEESPLKPVHPYGRSKTMAEQILLDYEEAFGINSVRFRYFNVSGAALDKSNGLRRPESTHLIKAAAETAAGKRNHLKIYGTQYPTPDGTCVRDYIHVEDLAELHLKALNYLEKNTKGITLNCGYGEGFSVKQVINAMKKVSGVDFPVENSAPRPGDTPQLVAGVSLLAKTFDWRPKYNDLELICRTTLEWEKKLPHLPHLST